MKRVYRIMCSLMAFLMTIFAASCGKGADFSHGQISNNVYTSSFLDLRFAPGVEWVFEQPEYTDDIEEFLKENSTIIDLKARNPKTGDSVVIQLENLTNKVGSNFYTAEDYLEKTVQVLEGYTVSEIGTRSLNGREYLSFEAETVVEDNSVNLLFMAQKKGDFIVGITVTSFEGMGLGNDKILEIFKGAENE